MKKCFSNLFLLFFIGSLSILTVDSASAAWVPLGDSVSLESLQETSLIVGDKEFSEFSLSAFATGGAITPEASTIFVQGGIDNTTGNYGLHFDSFSWSAASGQIINANLKFKVAILSGPQYENYFIKDVSFYLTGVSATDTGMVSSAETVWDAPFPDGKVIASLSVSKQKNDGGAYLIDSAEFAPVKEIWIHSKDISLVGGTGEGGSAHLSEFYQYYSQIPEPATTLILLSGMIPYALKKYKLNAPK